MTKRLFLLVAVCTLVLAAGTNSALAVPPFFSENTKRAAFISPLERWMPTWNLDGYVSLLQRAGYQVDVLRNENASISFFRNGLANYDLIILRTDSFVYEGNTYYCAGDSVSSETSRTLAAEILSGQVKVGLCVGFTATFLLYNYPAGSKLLHGLVHGIGSGTADLSGVFLGAGSSAFTGFVEDSSLGWGRMDSLSLKLFDYMSQGYTVKEAVIQVYNYLATGHGITADWPSLYWSGDGGYSI